MAVLSMQSVTTPDHNSRKVNAGPHATLTHDRRHHRHRQQCADIIARFLLTFSEQFTPSEYLIGVEVVLAGDARNGCVRQQRLGDGGLLEFIGVAPVVATFSGFCD